MVPDEPSQAQEKRGPLRFLRGALGCTALALGALFAFVVFAPTALSPLAGRYLQRELGERYRGRFEVGSVHLAWTARQSIEGLRLFDPDGERVGELSLRAPSLLELLRGRGERLGRIEVDAVLALVADASGTSNLERCLEPTAPAEEERPASERRGERAPARYELELALACEELSWSDPTTRASGTPVALRDVRGTLRMAPGEPLELDLAGVVSAAHPGVLRAEVRIDDPFRFRDLARPSPYSLDLELAGVPTALVDTLAGQGGRLAQVLGEDLRLRATGRGTAAAGDLSLELEAEHARLALAGRVEGARFRAEPSPAGPALALELREEWLAPVLAELGAELLPEGASLAPRASPQLLEVSVEELDLPLGAVLEGQGDPTLALLRGALARAVVRAGDWRWREAGGAGEDGGRALEIGDVEAHLALRAPDASGSKPFGIELRAALAEPANTAGAGTGARSDGAGSLVLALAGGDLTMLVGWTQASPLPPLTVSLDARELDTAFADAWIGASDGSALLARLGPRATLSFEATASRPAGGSFDVALRTEAAVGSALELALRAQLADEALRIRGEERLELKFRPSAELFGELTSALAGGSTPEGSALALAPGATIVLTCSELELPLGAVVASEENASTDAGAAAPAPALPELVRALEARIALAAPELAWTQPAPGAAGAPLEVRLRELRLEALFVPDQPARLALDGAVAGPPPGALDFDVVLEHPEALAASVLAPVPADPLDPSDSPGAAAAAPAGYRAVVTGRVEGLPSGLVDALAAQGGLLVDVLGPFLELELEGAWPDDARPIVARLRSEKASLTLQSRLEGGVLVAGDEGELEASVGLTPLFSRRVVGNLVPLLVGVTKPAGAGPAALTAKRFRLPLDGDLAQVSGEIVLALGQVQYQLLPGLEELLRSAGAESAVAGIAKLEPILLQIERGNVRVDRLPLRVGGETLAFRGGYDMAKGSLQLSTEIPLELLGSGVEKKLDEVRQYLDPKLAVPIELTGSFARPRVRLGEQFLKTVVENAAQNALRKGLGDFLRDKLKRDG